MFNQNHISFNNYSNNYRNLHTNTHYFKLLTASYAGDKFSFKLTDYP